MALVKYGGGVVQMAGSIAGQTHARNKYGNYIRARTKPVNPNTGRQQAVRAALAFLTSRWSADLTAGNRASWDLYASNVVMLNRLGESIHLSGYNHYLRSNIDRKRQNLAVIDAGPVVFELPEQDPLYAVSASEATQQIQHTFDVTLAWVNEDGAYAMMYCGQPQNAQRNFFGGPWRTIGYLPGALAAPPASPFASAAPFGLAELQHLWCYWRVSRADGRLSEPFRDDCFIGA